MDSIHPALVHFPIALLILLGVLELGRTFVGRPESATIRVIAWSALIGIIAAYWSGQEELETVSVVGNLELERLVGNHENSAKALLWVFPLAILLLELSLKAPNLRWPIWGFRFVLAGSIASVAITGYRGGELVYSHGIGTKFAAGLDKFAIQGRQQGFKASNE